MDHIINEALGAIEEEGAQANTASVAPAVEGGKGASGLAGHMDLLGTFTGDQIDSQLIFAADGTPIRQRQTDPRRLAMVARSYKRVMEGKMPLASIVAAMTDSYAASQLVQETMMSSEFANLLGSTQDRLLLARYSTYAPSYRDFLYANRRVRDFRKVGSVRRHGGRGLKAVPEAGSYPQEGLSESAYEYQVGKYGMTYHLTWEDIVNDDLGAFASLPDDMANDAIQEEMAFASSLYVGNTTLFKTDHDGGDGNTYSNTATTVLNKTNLLAAWNAMLKFPGDKKHNGTAKPLANTPVYLVVPPVLDVVAFEILGTMGIQWVGNEGSSPVAVAFPTLNGMQGRLNVRVDPYIPIIDSTNGHTSWFLFSDPNNGLHAAELGFLRGYEAPQLFRRAGGQTPESMGESFGDDTLAWKVRHVFGGSHAAALGNWRGCYRSTGAGS